MPVHVASHPLISHKMTLLRDAKTTGQDFRKLLQEITFFLGYESSQSLEVNEKKITTPTGASCNGSKLNQSISIIPILRAGLGMADTMSDIIPLAAVHHIGMYRTKHSLLPIQYYNRLPKGQASDVAFIMDPCIATSNTINAVSFIYSISIIIL
jgi:uracil phosphoribosyltransferase